MSGHGHVVPNADGSKARCGGPMICSECALEAARLTPAPKDAPVEPDFAAMIQQTWARYQREGSQPPWNEFLVRAAFAAGRQAAPQPEGGPTGERERKAYRYLERLFNSVAPQCQPLPTLMGLCTQIDNYIAGYRQHCAALEAALRKCEADYAAALDAAMFVEHETTPERVLREIKAGQIDASLFQIRAALTTAKAGKVGHFSILEDGPGRFVLCDDRTDDPAPVYATREEAERAARAGKGEDEDGKAFD